MSYADRLAQLEADLRAGVAANNALEPRTTIYGRGRTTSEWRFAYLALESFKQHGHKHYS